jgi:hypothetical protein
MARLSKEHLLKMERCSPLLPVPGPEVVEELLGHIYALESDLKLERAAAMREAAGLACCGCAAKAPIVEKYGEKQHDWTGFPGQYTTGDLALSLCVGQKYLALIPQADAHALDKHDEEMQHKGWVDCLRNVVASLEGYPNHGGDIDVMKALDKLLAEARLEWPNGAFWQDGEGDWRIDFKFLQKIKLDLPKGSMTSEEEIEEVLLAALRYL